MRSTEPLESLVTLKAAWPRRKKKTEEKSYNTAGLLEKEIISKTQYSGFKQIEKVYGYLYDPTGRKSFEIDTQGGITHYVYDQAGRLTESWSPETGTMVNNGKKTREALGLISTGPGPFEKMHLNSEENKALSDLWDIMPAAGHNHLKQNQNSWVERFTYDANGNRQTRETPLGTINYSYSGSDHNRLTAEGNKRYEYDKAGNIAKEILPTKETVFSYTEENRIASLSSVSGKESVQVNYAYDGLGRRVSQNSETRNNNRVTEIGQEGYSYQGTGMRLTSRFYETNPVSEGNAKKFLTSAEGTRFRDVNEAGISDRSYQQYHYGNERVAVMSQNEVSATDLMGGRYTNGSTESRYYSTDIQGSVRAVTDEEAKEEAQYKYSSFGELTEGEFDEQYTLGYNGKIMDRHTGLANYGFRDYSPTSGRFTTVDPIKDGLNFYVLCANDPINFVDPDGLKVKDLSDESKSMYMNDNSNKNSEFGNSTIGKEGCAATATTRVINDQTKKTITPSTFSGDDEVYTNKGIVRNKANEKALGPNSNKWDSISNTESNPTAVKDKLDELEASDKNYYVTGKATIAYTEDGEEKTGPHHVNITGYEKTVDNSYLRNTMGIDVSDKYDVQIWDTSINGKNGKRNYSIYENDSSFQITEISYMEENCEN